MREQQADLKIQVAQLSTQFGNSYPKVVQLNTQLKEVDAQLQAEMTKVVSRVRSDYLAALQHETMLRQALDKQKQEANKLNESAIEYSLLKRDVESNRTLYEGLMEKLKEAGVTAGLRSNNIRSVDKARVPTYPSEPNVPRNLDFRAGARPHAPESAWPSCWKASTTPCARRSRRRPYPPCPRSA